MKNLTSVLPFNVAEYSPVCMNIGDNSSDSLRGEILNNVLSSLYFYKVIKVKKETREETVVNKT